MPNNPKAQLPTCKQNKRTQNKHTPKTKSQHQTSKSNTQHQPNQQTRKQLQHHNHQNKQTHNANKQSQTYQIEIFNHKTNNKIKTPNENTT